MRNTHRARHAWLLARFLLSWGFLLWLLEIAARDPAAIPFPVPFLITWTAAWMVDSAVRFSHYPEPGVPGLLALWNTLAIGVAAGIHTAWASFGAREGMLWLLALSYPFGRWDIWIRMWRGLRKA